MKKHTRSNRMLILPVAILLLIVTAVLTFSGCAKCNHENMEDEVVLQPTCGMPGKKVSKCTNCEYSTESTIPATEQHNYGAWVQSSETSMYRTCAACGSVESSHVSGADNATASDTYTYTTFSSFESDCLNGNFGLTYNGSYNKIVVSLGGGNYTNTCENKKVIIPARVTDVHFIGIATGSPFSNFTLELEERIQDINITFNDVRIESNTTILTSTSRFIDVNIKMLGQKCSFMNIGKGNDGANGINGATNDNPKVYGESGDNGAPAFKINGTVTVYSQSSILEIQGGNGGNGGAGGHITTSKAPHGGKGGNGGDGISGEELATVYVAPNCVVNIQGGAGGEGGAPGKSEAGFWGSNKTGNRGENGSAGNSGCRIQYQN